MPIRHNGTESEQVVISFLRITYTVAFCRFLTRCKRLAGKDGLLMVKLTAVDPRGACCTRYPLHPRRGGHTGGIWRHMDGYRFTPVVSGGKLYIELTGSFGRVIAACKAILSMSWSRFTRMPDNIACRLGSSMATPTAQMMATLDRIQTYYFFNGRWPYMQIQRSWMLRTCAYVEVLKQFDLQPALASTTYRLLRCQCGDKKIPIRLIMDYLSVGSWHLRRPERVLSGTLYVLTVHSRMFNELEGFEGVEAVIERFPSLDLWANSAVEHAAWRVHPMVLQP